MTPVVWKAVRSPNVDRHRLCAWLLAAAAAVQFMAMIGPMWELADPEAFTLPRLKGWGLSRPVLVAIAAGWLIGVAAFLAPRWVSRLGWVLPLTLSVVLSLDQQIGGGHIYLVAIAGTLLVGYAWTRRGATTAVAPILLWALQAQVSIVLFWAAIGKVNPRFLSGGVLAASLGDGIVPVPSSLLTPGFLRPAALVIIAVELFVGLGLWLPRFRPVALSLAFALHAGIFLLMTPTLVLLAFGLAMAAGYVLFLPKRETVAA